MTFHPSSLKLEGDLKSLNDSIKDKPIILYKGFLHSNIFGIATPSPPLPSVAIESKFEKIH